MSVLLLSACVSDDTYLPALLADPMANYEAERVELVEKHTQGQGETPVLGGTVVARVLLRYEVLEQDAVGALADAVAFAGKNGWNLIAAPIPGVTDERFTGEKDLGVGLAAMTLAIDRAEAQGANSGIVTLGISLVFDQIDEGADPSVEGTKEPDEANPSLRSRDPLGPLAHLARTPWS